MSRHRPALVDASQPPTTSFPLLLWLSVHLLEGGGMHASQRPEVMPKVHHPAACVMMTSMPYWLVYYNTCNARSHPVVGAMAASSSILHWLICHNQKICTRCDRRASVHRILALCDTCIDGLPPAPHSACPALVALHRSHLGPKLGASMTTARLLKGTVPIPGRKRQRQDAQRPFSEIG